MVLMRSHVKQAFTNKGTSQTEKKQLNGHAAVVMIN